MDFSIFRAARAARGLSRTAVAELTKLSPGGIASIEEGRLESLPGGIYARTYVRAYADAVGISDPLIIQQLTDALPTSDVDLVAVVKCREQGDGTFGAYRRAAIMDAAVVLAISG